MAAVAAVAASAAPAPALSAPPRDGTRASASAGESRAHFDDVMNRSSATTERGDAGARGPVSERIAKDAAAAAEDRTARVDREADDDKPAPIDEARGLLGWLQLQWAAPAAAAPASAAPALPASGQGSAAAAALPVVAAGAGAAVAAATVPAGAGPAGSTTPGLESSSSATALPFALAAAGRAEASAGPVADGLAAAVSDLLSPASAPADALRPEVLPLPAAQPVRNAADPAPVAAPAAALTSTVRTPITLDSPDLPVQLGERLHWLAGNGVQEARLQLHPRDLGSIDVQIRIEARGASVWFAADHPAARTALESALPQLRERFAADGLQLGQAQVSAQTSAWTFGDSSREPARPFTPGPATASADAADDALDPAPARVPVLHIGLVDRYA